MSTLQKQLNDLKSNFEKQAPEDALTIMHRATRDLENSGMMDGVAKVGDTAPDFELTDNDDNIIRLKDILAENPLVLSFFRGQW